MVKGLIPVIRTVHDMKKSAIQALDTYLDPMTVTLRLTVVAFSLLNHTRKDVVRNEQHELAKLCTWDTSVGIDSLFGGDILKKLKDVQESTTLDLKTNKRFPPAGPSWYYNRGFGHSHGGRGRGGNYPQQKMRQPF